MKVKLHIKKNDLVKVLAGDSKGQEGKILSIDRVKNRAIVEGINIVSKHTKPDAKNPQGGIIRKEASVHISNLMLIDPKTGKAIRVGRKLDETSKKISTLLKKNRGGN